MRRFLPLGGLVVALCAAAPAAAQQPEVPVEYITADPSLPFSQVVRVGNTLYLSGMLGTVPGTGLVPGGIQPETRQALENIRGALERAGATMDNLVKCTVFLADIGEWGQMTETYVTFFPRHRPARTAVAVSGLPLNGRVEIECIAVLGARDAQ